MNPEEKQTNEPPQPYEVPQIIFESQITTRAGSPLSNPISVDDIDPADLFGS